MTEKTVSFRGRSPRNPAGEWYGLQVRCVHRRDSSSDFVPPRNDSYAVIPSEVRNPEGEWGRLIVPAFIGIILKNPLSANADSGFIILYPLQRRFKAAANLRDKLRRIDLTDVFAARHSGKIAGHNAAFDRVKAGFFELVGKGGKLLVAIQLTAL